MKEKINVLVFPAGEVNAIELHDALSSCVNINLFGASSVERHGKYVFKNYISGLPMITDENFFYEFNKIIDEYSIDVIFPTHDTITAFLAENAFNLKAKLVGGDAYTARVCRSKHETHTLFADCNFIPKTYYGISSISEYPVFIKPDKGHGGVGSRVINNIDELKDINFKEYIVEEFLEGEELSVDCITDKNGNLKLISPRTRDRVFAGISSAGRITPLTDEIKYIAETINSRLNFSGLWFFQIKKDSKGNYKLLEVSTRCASSMCLTRARGANLPLLSVYTVMGYDISVYTNPYEVEMDRTLISRYCIDYDYDKVYVDFDDTLIINDEVNLNLIRFLYQCKNKKKKIILITKHEKEIEKSFLEYSLSESLFTKIIHIDMNQKKSDYIDSVKAIFIDNSFREREEIFLKYSIPVFDVDTIEVLLDWRT